MEGAGPRRRSSAPREKKACRARWPGTGPRCRFSAIGRTRAPGRARRLAAPVAIEPHGRGHCGRALQGRGGFRHLRLAQLAARGRAPGTEPGLGLRRAVGGRVGNGEGRAAGLAAGHVDLHGFGAQRQRAVRAVGLAGQERDQARIGDRHLAPVEGGAAGGEEGGRGSQRKPGAGGERWHGGAIIEPCDAGWALASTIPQAELESRRLPLSLPQSLP
jgi:hypothetical protein